METLKHEIEDITPKTRKERRVFGIEMMVIVFAVCGMGALGVGIFLYETFVR